MRGYDMDGSYIPPLYRIIQFIDEIRLDIRERRFIRERQEQAAREWRAKQQ